MSNPAKTLLAAGLMVAAACLMRTSLAAPAQTPADEVRAAETAFAKTMADRDFASVANYVADEAVFFGGNGVSRGRAAVLASWKSLYDGPQAPFSWKPETVEVLDSGKLALSTGPVFDPEGKLVGVFNSIWRREQDGQWRVVFDKGCDVCDCTKAQ